VEEIVFHLRLPSALRCHQLPRDWRGGHHDFNDNFADTLFFASQKILISISNIVIQMTHNDLSTVVIVLGNTLTL
jgi:hypothetical protein